MSKYSPDYQIKIFNRANKGIAIAAGALRLLLVFLSFTFFAVVNAQESQELTGYGRDLSIIENLRVNHAHKDFPLKNLVDMELDANERFYFSGRSEDVDGGWTEGAYLEVDVKADALDPSKAEDIFVLIRRYKDDSYPSAQPTMMEVKGLPEGGGDNDWKTLFYAYFIFRGPCTTALLLLRPIGRR